MNLPLSLNAGTSTTFNVQFLPQSAGTVAGTLSIVSNAPNSPTAVVLSGTGVASTLTLSLSSSSLSFGNVNTGSSASQTVTITDTGNANVTISQINISGSGFSLSGAGTPVTLSPTQGMTVTVQFSPSAVGSVSGNVSIVSNASGSPAEHYAIGCRRATDDTFRGAQLDRQHVDGLGIQRLSEHDEWKRIQHNQQWTGRNPDLCGQYRPKRDNLLLCDDSSGLQRQRKHIF